MIVQAQIKENIKAPHEWVLWGESTGDQWIFDSIMLSLFLDSYCTAVFIWISLYSQPVHYNGIKMSVMASQITSLTIVYSSLYSGADQSKHQSSMSRAFVSRIHQSLVNSPHKWPVTRKMFLFDDVIMSSLTFSVIFCCYSKYCLYWFRHLWYDTRMIITHNTMY